MTASTEALIEKIRKLRAKAEDAATTEAEASIFAEKVASLLQQHGLSESVFHTDEPEQIVSESYEGDYLTDEWRRAICNAVAKLYFCAAYSTEHVGKTPSGHLYQGSGKRTKNHVFVGRPHNIVVAREMSDYLIRTTVRLGKSWRNDNFESHSNMVMFLRACGVRIAQRLIELCKAQTAAAPLRSASGAASNLPALYADESALVKAFTDRLGLKTMRARQSAEGHGASAGRRAGDTVSLSTQIRGPGAARLLS